MKNYSWQMDLFLSTGLSDEPYGTITGFYESFRALGINKVIGQAELAVIAVGGTRHGGQEPP